ncbi:glycosyltransferase [Acidianus sulfidivorans JP7]|uniref:Glycosyl transferase n=1 Tax=Acidianus sulfidivorans JP7 TaxID=619593 RepID=A0A2U9IPK2_9CREN|nr:glycosyltransferase [Acidianus sulfidivorans]AWR97941.1 glycosyltransferase [Acidianus sulfidivorans JP7]
MIENIMNEYNYIFISTILLFIGFIYFLINSYLAISTPKFNPKSYHSLKDVTAVIPVYNEDPKLFEQVIKTISVIKFIVVGDGCVEPYNSITRKYDGTFIAVKKRSGKRNALAEGLKMVNTPFVVFLDSDTILPKRSLLHMLSLIDDKTGGISPRVLMLNNGKFSYYYAEFFERMSEILQRALSKYGKAAVLYGHCALYRTELIKDLILSKDFKEPKILGKKFIIGDDRQLTNHVLNKGYKAFIDYDSIAFTAPPEDIKKFTNQVIRWTKSNYLYFINDIVKGTIIKKGPLYIFNSIYTNVLPFFFLIFTLISFGTTKIFDINDIFEYPEVFIYSTIKLIHYMLAVPAFLGIHYFFDPSKLSVHINIHNSFHKMIREVNNTHLGYIDKSIRIASSISSLPFVIALIRMIKRDKIKVLVLGSVALGVQLFAAFYSILTLWMPDSWRTR